MSEQELAAIEARADAATPGPWRAELFHTVWVVEYGPENDKSECFDLLEDPSRETVAFIASARTDVPALAAEVRRLRKICADAAAYLAADFGAQCDSPTDDLVTSHPIIVILRSALF